MSPDLSGLIGTRVSKNVAGQTTSFLRDGVDVTDPVIADSLATYTPGVSERRGGTTRYTHSGLKNTGAQSTNAIVATRVYDAYGMVRSTTGTWSGPFGYGGGYGYQEDETGLRLLGHRYYDASTGRFLTRDPIKDGRNWYSYCDGDPINGVDPTGLYRVILGRHPVSTAPQHDHYFIIIDEDNEDYWVYEGGWTWDWPPKVGAGVSKKGTGGYKKRRPDETLTEIFRNKKSGSHARKLAKQFVDDYAALQVRYGKNQNSNSFASLLLWLLTGEIWIMPSLEGWLRTPGWLDGEVGLGPASAPGGKRTPGYFPPVKYK